MHPRECRPETKEQDWDEAGLLIRESCAEQDGHTGNYKWWEHV